MIQLKLRVETFLDGDSLPGLLYGELRGSGFQG
jgi:hypothetical protein